MFDEGVREGHFSGRVDVHRFFQSLVPINGRAE